MSPIKVRLSPGKRKNVAKELEDALEREFFKKQWPLVEEPVSSKLKNKSAIVGKGRGKDRTREPMEESRVFQAEMMDEQKRRKEEMMRQWKEKPERNIEGRRRVQGRLEDMWGMVPTLQQFNSQQPRRDAPAGKGGMEPQQTNHRESGRLHSERRNLVTTDDRILEYRRQKLIRSAKAVSSKEDREPERNPSELPNLSTSEHRHREVRGQTLIGNREARPKKKGEKRDDQNRDRQHSTQPSRTTTGHRTQDKKHSRQRDKTEQKNSLKQENRSDPRTTGNHRDACLDEKLRFRSRTTTENRVEEHKHADEAEKSESNDAMQRLKKLALGPAYKQRESDDEELPFALKR